MEPAVLDLAQLARIQGTHRGFLYQHLYATVCLLAAPRTGVLRVRVERDEDVELVGAEGVLYAQVKTRSAPLVPSDIGGMDERFSAIREAHECGDRVGIPRFAIVTNVEMGVGLSARTWPADVLVVTPSTSCTSLEGTGLSVPRPSVNELLRDAHGLAEAYRLSALRPDSLVAKLVGLVARAAAGEGPDETFAACDLDRLCELVAAQLRPLPIVEPYRRQLREPSLPDTRASLAVVGHAGEGKTSWAAEVAAHSPEVAVYVPCSSSPGEQIAPRLVDSTVATLVARGSVRAHELVLPGRTGTDALSLLDRQLAERGFQVLAIIDDCHHATTATVVAAMRAAPSIRWLLLGHPSSTMNEVAALMGIAVETLGGWDEDVVAALLDNAGCSTRPADVAALQRATGGAPLFVLHAVEAIRRGTRDTGAYARALVEGTTPGRTAQEILLEGAITALPTEAARVASALASIDVGFRTAEWIQFIGEALGVAAAKVRRALRALVVLRVAYETRGEVVAIHDAFRPLLAERFLAPGVMLSIREQAAKLLRTQLLNELQRRPWTDPPGGALVSRGAA